MMQEDTAEVTERALAVVPAQRGGMVMPVVSAVEAQRAVAAYEALKRALLTDKDIHTDKGKTYIKRNGWRRIAQAFGISLQLVSEDRIEEAGGYRYAVMYRAIAPNGQYTDGDGMCSKAEFGRSEHDVRAKAHTRAKNRAISDLVGGGEVSADELGDYDDDDRSARQEIRQETRQTQTRQAGKSALYKLMNDQDALTRLAALDIDTTSQEDIRAFFAGRNLHPPFTRAAVDYALKQAEADARTVEADTATPETNDLATMPGMRP